MSEMALTAEHLIVIGRGKLLADTSVTDFIDQNSAGGVRVRTPQVEAAARRVRPGRHQGHRRRQATCRSRA